MFYYYKISGGTKISARRQSKADFGWTRTNPPVKLVKSLTNKDRWRMDIFLFSSAISVSAVNIHRHVVHSNKLPFLDLLWPFVL